jgi:hypothetical protein
LLSPTVQAISAVPSPAWVPLLLLWLGIGETPKIVLVAIGAFFPVCTTVSDAVAHTGPHPAEVVQWPRGDGVAAAEEGVDGDVEAEVGDDTDDGGDAGQRCREGPVAAQAFDVGGAQQDEQEAGYEGDPGGEQGRDDACGPGVQGAGVVVGAEERDELHHHDERSGSGLGQGRAADHVGCGELAVVLDGALRDVGQHGVGPPKVMTAVPEKNRPRCV